MNIEANWDNSNSGTYIHNSGTVNIQGSGNSTISGNTTFYNFSSSTAGKQINLTAGTNQQIDNDLTLNGMDANEIELRSTAANMTWTMTFPNGAQTVAEVDVQDGIAATNSVTVGNGTDSGNNTNWIFQDTRYWIGTGGNWNDTSNWATSSGGTGGASVPDSGDLVIFDGNSGAATINTSVNVTEFDIQATYSKHDHAGLLTLLPLGQRGFRSPAGISRAVVRRSISMVQSP